MQKLFLILSLLFVSFIIFTEEVRLVAKVERAIDGDTFIISIDDNDSYKESIRIALIDTYETKQGKKLETQANYFKITSDEALSRGLQAKELAKSLVGQQATLIIEQDKDGKLERETRGYRLIGRLEFAKIGDYGEYLKNNNLAYDYWGKELYK